MTKKQNETLDRFLSLLEERSTCKSVDRALWHLLCEYRDRLPVLDGYFHKAFRQCDVLPSGKLDMVAWHLIQASTLFDECYRDARKRKVVTTREQI